MRGFLFLDIDGVLCTSAAIQARGSNALDFSCVERLNRVMEGTNLDIVISSSWRVIYSKEHIQEKFVAAGFRYPERIIAATPTWKHVYGNIVGAYPTRGEEIIAWLRKEGHQESLAIILDDTSGPDIAPLYDHLVHVDQGWFNGGMQDLHVEIIKRSIQHDCILNLENFKATLE